MQITDILARLTRLPGPSGAENPVFNEISHILQPFFHRVESDSLQNGYLWRFCGRNDAPRIMFAVHIDEIGLYVHAIEKGGFVRVRAIGGVDPRTLLGQEMMVWPQFPPSGGDDEVDGKKQSDAVFAPARTEPIGLPAICGVKPPHILSKEEREKSVPIKDLFLDLGLPEKEVRARVSVGDPVTYHRPLTPLLNGRVSGKALDNRLSAALLVALCHELWGDGSDGVGTGAADEQLQADGAASTQGSAPANTSLSQGTTPTSHGATRNSAALAHGVSECDIVFAFTTQEELGLRGAQIAAERIRPEVAIVIDVGFGDMPGQDEDKTIRLEAGPALTCGPNIHPGLRRALQQAAEQADIAWQGELAPGSTGTDAWAIQIAGVGVATALLSLPLRYMHTPVETAALDDIRHGARLLARFVQNVTAEEVRSWAPLAGSIPN